MQNQSEKKETYEWQDLLAIVTRLRQPDGCPWDRVQTYESMKQCVLDEAQEVVDAVENEDFINLREELGDLLLQVLMYANIAEERKEFTLEAVIDELAKKLIRRHPHVFGDHEATSKVEEGQSIWKAIKIKEKQERLKEYEAMYEQGRISKKLLELQREKVQENLDKNVSKPVNY